MKGVEAFTKAELAELEILAAKWVSLENPRAHEYDAYKAAQALSDLQDAALGKISANPLRLLATIERQGKAIEDLELRLHQTNDAHALSCSEHLKALTEIERQGKALRAVESLESFGATVELTTLLGTREMVTGAEVEVVSAAQLRAALAERGANDKHEL